MYEAEYRSKLMTPVAAVKNFGKGPKSWDISEQLAGTKIGAADDLARSLETRLDRSLCQSAEQQRAQVLSCEMDLSFSSLQMRQQRRDLSRPIVCVCTERIDVFVPGFEQLAGWR